jgi:glycosyltransferase involved in cell wall biosynthesis
MLPKVKVLFVSRDLPLPNTYGIGAYVLSLGNYLHQMGCEIEYIVLGIANNSPGWIVPAEMDAIGRVVVDRGIRLGSHVLLSLAHPTWWLVAPIKYAYLAYIPEDIRQGYREIKHWLRPSSVELPTEARSLLPPAIAPPTDEDVEFVLKRQAAFAPDVIIVNHAWLSDLFRHLPYTDRALRVALAPDIMHQRKTDFEARGLHAGLGDWDEDIERTFLSNAEVVLAIQEDDAQVLRKMLPEREIICAPIAMPVRPRSRVSQSPGRCLFVGSYVDHNVLGLRWFLESVWPLILARDPQASLHVCGEVCKSVSRPFPNVRLLGQVENLDNEYGAAEVCLVPLHVGSGLKIKLIQALSHGRVCVSTSVGVQGLSVSADTGVCVADSPSGFSDAVHNVLNNPELRRQMEQGAYWYVEANYAPDNVFANFVHRISEHIRDRQVASGR